MSLLAFRPLAAAALGALACAGAARAELGGPIATVQADRARMGARIASHALGSYTRHELTRSNGGTVRELTNARGQVFAVTWSGPGKPDLRSLLGRHFARLQAASGAYGATMHALRRPPQVSEPDLQIQTSGHLGWFRGVAFVPSLAPAEFAANDLATRP